MTEQIRIPSASRTARTLSIEDGVAALLIALLIAPSLTPLLTFGAWSFLGEAPPYSDPRVHLAAALPRQLLCALLLLGLVYRRAPGRIRAADATGVGIAPPRAGWFRETTTVFFMVLGVVVLAVMLFNRLGVESSPGAVNDMLVASGGIERLAFIVTAVLVAPAIEEFTYRGVLLASIATRFGAAIGVAASTLLFTIVHIDDVGWPPVGLISVVAVGLSAALLRVRTGSLFPPICLHIAWNVMVTLVLDTAGIW